jgi:ribokinase
MPPSTRPSWLTTRPGDGAGLLVLQNEAPAAEQARKRGVRVILNAAPLRPQSRPFAQLVDVLGVTAFGAEMMGAGHVCCLASAS